MNEFNHEKRLQFLDAIDLRDPRESILFNHYCKFFSNTVVEDFKKMNSSNSSFKSHQAWMLELQTYVVENIKYDSQADYLNLVDTLRILCETDFEGVR